jgi:uncharacterized GH25 family protein
MRRGSATGAGALAVVAAMVLAPRAQAHDTWLLPQSAHAAVGAVARVAMTSGGAFPKRESPIDPDRIARAEVREAGVSRRIPRRFRASDALELAVPLDSPGVAIVAVSLRPKTLVLEDAKIGEYLDEIDARETAGAAWARMPSPKRWKESYRKHAKTYLRTADSGDESWKRPIGLALEIVAVNDPTLLQSGDTLSVRILRDGAPLPDFSVRADPGAGGRVLRKKTDADGAVAFALDRPGPWLLAGTDLRWDERARMWRSDFTTLTVSVAPKTGR